MVGRLRGLRAALAGALMANYKRRRGKAQRSGCLLCKMHKLPSNKHSEKAKAERAAFAHERAGG